MADDTLMRSTVKIIKNPQADFFGQSVKDFLYRLNGPAWIDISGEDRSRTRVLSTLLHGNEPSGIKALFNWLKRPDRKKPLTNISFFICSVEAALTEPEFSHRYIVGAPDMNRCFRPPFDSANGKLAENVLKRIKNLKPEMVLDMHNTSGSGPDFTVSPSKDIRYTALASNFSNKLIITSIKLGSLMEADVGCPVITLECGGSNDLNADLTALTAIEVVATRDTLFHVIDKRALDIFTHPLRLELKENVSIGYGKEPIAECDVTLEVDIEKHNFGLTPDNCFLGWVGPKGLDYFTAIDDQGRDIKADLFKVRNNQLMTACSLRLFMVTPRPEIAKKDCLFYLVRTNET